MDHTKHKVSLELAKRLKDAGYPQEQSEWYWVDDGTKYHRYKISNHPFSQDIDSMACRGLAAPTVAELGEELKEIYSLPTYGKMTKEWGCDQDHPEVPYPIREETEADARAKMWLMLKRNGCSRLTSVKGREIKKEVSSGT